MRRTSFPRRGTVPTLVAAIVAFIVGFLLANDSDKPKATPRSSMPHPAARPSPSPQPAQKHPLIRVVGYCASGSGTLFLFGKGFTPNGKYVTEVIGPNHKPYTRLGNPGQASSTGTTPNWRFLCEKDDPPGRYGLRLFDLESQEYSNPTGFEIFKP